MSDIHYLSIAEAGKLIEKKELSRQNMSKHCCAD